MKIETTFRHLREAEACKTRYKLLAENLGGVKKYGERTPITLLQILESNGLKDVLWVLYNKDIKIDDEGQRLLHKFACWCAERTLSKAGVKTRASHNAIKAKKAWLNGKISTEDLAKIHKEALGVAWRTFERGGGSKTYNSQFAAAGTALELGIDASHYTIISATDGILSPDKISKELEKVLTKAGLSAHYTLCPF